MDMYKKAIREGLRFDTNRGQLSTEQLFGLKRTDLASLVKSTKKVLVEQEADDELAFLEENKSENRVNALNRLRFEIAKDVFLTKKAEDDAVRDAKDIKDHNQKILALINEKQEEGLKSKSIDELKAMMR